MRRKRVTSPLVMESSIFTLFFVLVLLQLSTLTASQDCSLPDDAMINTRLRSLVISINGEGATLSTTLLDHHFTCLAVGSSRDQYRQVSVAVRYTKNTASGQFTAQFPLRCTSGNFGTVGELNQSPPANVFDINTRRDCFICTTVGSHPSFTIDTAADCAREWHTACHHYNLYRHVHVNSQYVAVPVWWRVKVAVWTPLLTVVHSTTLMAPAPHLVHQALLLQVAVTTPVVSIEVSIIIIIVHNSSCSVWFVLSTG